MYEYSELPDTRSIRFLLFISLFTSPTMQRGAVRFLLTQQEHEASATSKEQRQEHIISQTLEQPFATFISVFRFKCFFFPFLKSERYNYKDPTTPHVNLETNSILSVPRGGILVERNLRVFFGKSMRPKPVDNSLYAHVLLRNIFYCA